MGRNMLSVYIHIPFCISKCPYCDFYSACPKDEDVLEQYTQAVCMRIASYGEKYVHREVGTVYFGGGTPSVLGAEKLCRVLSAVRSAFSVHPEAEITVECNPADVNTAFFSKLKNGGVNRISMGMQSANEDELHLLGRRHTAEDAKRAMQSAREAGINNVSVDLMLALPDSDFEKLKKSIDFCAELGADHVSAYILKIEPGTPFWKMADTLCLPDEDGAADQYLFMVEKLREHGYEQYEISNFTKPGKESRHNLQYWRCEEYLGIGPAAHSFVSGKRFFFPRDMKVFLEGCEPQADGEGGSFSEFAMLALRLTEGLQRDVCERRFENGEALYDGVFKEAVRLPKMLVAADDSKIALTAEGFLVSNMILSEILPEE